MGRNFLLREAINIDKEGIYFVREFKAIIWQREALNIYMISKYFTKGSYNLPKGGSKYMYGKYFTKGR